MITSDYFTTNGTGDTLTDSHCNGITFTMIIVDECIDIIKDCEKAIRTLVWKFNFGGGIYEDTKQYKTIERPRVVETYRRFAKPFWTGKNFKKIEE